MGQREASRVPYGVPRIGEHLGALALRGMPGTGMPAMGGSVSSAEMALIQGYLESRAAAD